MLMTELGLLCTRRAKTLQRTCCLVGFHTKSVFTFSSFAKEEKVTVRKLGMR